MTIAAAPPTWTDAAFMALPQDGHQGTSIKNPYSYTKSVEPETE